MADEKITGEEFLDILEEIFVELDGHEEQLRGMKLSEAEEKALEKTLETTYEGIDLFQTGLELMGKYAVDPSRTHLNEGFDLVVRGAEKLSAIKPPG